MRSRVWAVCRRSRMVCAPASMNPGQSGNSVSSQDLPVNLDSSSVDLQVTRMVESSGNPLSTTSEYFPIMFVPLTNSERRGPV